MRTKLFPLLRLVLLVTVTAALQLHADTVQVSNSNIVGVVNWYATNEYVLNGYVFVETNEVLNIEAGTIIKGQTNATAATIAALVVARGGKIFANGTACRPIIFTSVLDDVLDPGELGLYQRGLWGGVVLMGNARLNTASLAAGNAASPKYDVYEGLDANNINYLFGGDNDDDNSGVLRYVSIRHGGKVLESNKEINGLSLCAVGRGTTIEYVESYAIADDGFEWFGGTVNSKHLVSAFNDDDCFDHDQGYRGKGQFWFAIQEPATRDKGMEINGEPTGISVGALPVQTSEAYNVTLIGAGAGSGGSANNTFTIRDYASPSIYNSIFTDFAQRGMSIDPTSAIHLTNGMLNFANNLWYGFTGGTDPNSATNVAITEQALVLFTDASRSNLIVSPQLRSISRTNDGGLDPRPAPGSPALSGLARAVPNNGFYESADYVGAFGTNGLWLSGWTALSAYGIITPDGGRRDPNTGEILPPYIVQVNNSSISGTVNWYRTNTYVLSGYVFVETNEVLNIEAGTVVKGQTNATAATIAALVVARGGKIFANGTAQNPIIFTSVLDNLDDTQDLGLYQRGLWGGLVLMGNARINTASLAAGNAASPKYDVYEGLDANNINYLFGGDNDDDNSGVLHYVSIRHGGKVLESNKEINGLSLCAVGRGTTIEYVESYAIADDGFEWFGGTVNSKHLVSAFNDDDCFDHDQGYRGKGQFWFAIQEPATRDKGMEINGEPTGISVGALPVQTSEAYNVTLIGAGAGSGGSANNTFTIRDYASPSIYNSIFTDFAQRGMSIDPTSAIHLTNGMLNFANNLWYGFTGGANPNSATNLAITPEALVLFTDASRSNNIVPPQLISISRANNNGLDPRPAPGSPAWIGARPVPNNGFYEAAEYQGAFGNLNWASDWTALGCYAVLTGKGAGTPRAGTVVTPPTPPTLSVSVSGTTLNITFQSQSGVNYQLQSATVLINGATVWTNEGSAVAGTGGVLTIPVSTSVGDQKFFQVQAQ